MINITSPSQYRVKDAAAMGLMTGSVVAVVDAGINVYKMKGQLTEDKFQRALAPIIGDAHEEMASVRANKNLSDKTKDILEGFYTRNIEKSANALESKMTNGRTIAADLQKIGYKGIAKQAGIVGGLAALGVMLLIGLAKLSASFTGRK